MVARRMNYLRKLLVCDDVLLQGALHLHTGSTMWRVWAQDFNFIKSRFPTLESLPNAVHNDIASINTWISFIIPADTTWHQMLQLLTRQKTTPHLRCHSLTLTHMFDPYLDNNNDTNTGPHQLPPHPHPHVQPFTIPTPTSTLDPHFDDNHHCHIYFAYFQNRKPLTHHKRTAHGIISPISLRIRNNTCPTCGSQLSTRSQLHQHLANRLICSLPLVMFTDPMSTEEYYNNIHELNTCNTAMSRTVIPRRGPIQ
eukprot:6059501-Amphidinium_carterae.7